MPKTVLGNKFSKPKDPPIDWFKAAILERMDTKGYTIKDLADEMHMSYPNMLRMMRKPPAQWKADHRDAVCRILGIKVALTVAGQPTR